MGRSWSGMILIGWTWILKPITEGYGVRGFFSVWFAYLLPMAGRWKNSLKFLWKKILCNIVTCSSESDSRSYKCFRTLNIWHIRIPTVFLFIDISGNPYPRKRRHNSNLFRLSLQHFGNSADRGQQHASIIPTHDWLRCSVLRIHGKYTHPSIEGIWV